MNVRTNQKIAAVAGLIYLLRKCLRALLLLKSSYSKKHLFSRLPHLNVSQAIAYLKSHPTLHSLDCFIQGFIRSDHPFPSLLHKTQKLICNIILGSYIYTNNPEQIPNPFDFKNKFISTKPKLSPSLKLYDISDPLTYGMIKLTPDASVSLAFSEIKTETSEIALGWLGKLWMIVAELLKRGLFFVGKFVRGAKVKEVREELGIKQNQFVNVAAKCSLVKDSLVIVVNNMVKQTHMFHEKLGKNIQGYKLSLAAFVVVTIAYAVFMRRILRLVYMNVKEYLGEQFPGWFRGRDGERAGEQSGEESEDSEDGQFSCCICYSRVRSVILKPCRHYGLCRECYKSLEYFVCPICKSQIEGVIEVKKRGKEAEVEMG